jgi:hypothetical protein
MNHSFSETGFPSIFACSACRMRSDCEHRNEADFAPSHAATDGDTRTVKPMVGCCEPFILNNYNVQNGVASGI